MPLSDRIAIAHNVCGFRNAEVIRQIQKTSADPGSESLTHCPHWTVSLIHVPCP